MALEQARSTWEKFSTPLVKRLEGVPPIVLTWMSLPIGLCGALLILMAGRDVQGGAMIFSGGLLIGISMILDGLDGTLARATDNVTRWGDYLDHTLDRILDVAWILAIGYNAHWVNEPQLAWAAALLTLLGSYLGTQAQAVIGSRNYGGFSRADRMILTLVALGLAVIMTLTDVSDPWTFPERFGGMGLNPLSAIVIISGLGGIWTFMIRFIGARSELRQLDAQEPLNRSEE